MSVSHVCMELFEIFFLKSLEIVFTIDEFYRKSLAIPEVCIRREFNRGPSKDLFEKFLEDLLNDFFQGNLE